MRYSRAHLGDRELLCHLTSSAAHDSASTADLLADIAEVDERRLYLAEGCESMHAYCVRVLHLAEGSASKRIWAARTAREFPQLFDRIADGRLHLSAVCLLATYLTPENVTELLDAATHQTKKAIESMLAERFPRTEELPLIETIRPFGGAQHSPGNVGMTKSEPAPPRIAVAAPPSRIEPIAHDRSTLHLTVPRTAHEDLEYSRALLGHQVPDGEIGAVATIAFRLLAETLERKKFGVTKRASTKTRSALSDRKALRGRPALQVRPEPSAREDRRARRARPGCKDCLVKLDQWAQLVRRVPPVSAVMAVPQG